MADITRTGVSGFGIKEVADVAFYNVGDVIGIDTTNGAVKVKSNAKPLFVLDTLKVSNIENTAEQADAKGGKGNAPLITWDYGREITISLQDAVLSMETLAMMFEEDVAGASDNEIVISANTFPGNYTVVGKTYARDIQTGKDDLFVWYVPKAKVNSEVTLTMEAEGDPTVFDMNLKVLRDENGAMVKMYKITPAEGTTAETLLTTEGNWMKSGT
jgi:hypothetical protein